MAERTETTVLTRDKEFDIEMSRRALDLADRGRGNVSPGPLVGCVIVSADGEIVGEGTYFYEEMTHAEITALNAAGPKAKGGTAYISLEPHSHHGRTAPCTAALIDAGIVRVVAPIDDPNPLVSGKGFEVLRKNGIEVEKGLLSREAEIQNEKFIHWHRVGRPFVHLKIAASLDGRIATKTGDSKWITGEESRKRAHELRHEYDAILVGSNTVAADNPSLTDRSGKKRHRPLLRVVLDTRLRLDMSSDIVKTATEIPTIIIADENAEVSKRDSLRARDLEVVEIPGGGRDLQNVLRILKDREIQSLLVEGGAAVAGSFLDKGLVDKFTVFIAPILIGGKDAPSAVGGEGPERIADAFRLRDMTIVSNGDDIELTGYPAGGETFRENDRG